MKPVIPNVVQLTTSIEIGLVVHIHQLHHNEASDSGTALFLPIAQNLDYSMVIGGAEPAYRLSFILNILQRDSSAHTNDFASVMLCSARNTQKSHTCSGVAFTQGLESVFLTFQSSPNEPVELSIRESKMYCDEPIGRTG